MLQVCLYDVGMTENFLIKAVEIAGGQTALADKLNARQVQDNVKQAHIWNWLNTTKDGVPAEQVRPVCEVCDWQVTPHQLRPDLYPHPHDGLPEHLRVAA